MQARRLPHAERKTLHRPRQINQSARPTTLAESSPAADQNGGSARIREGPGPITQRKSLLPMLQFPIVDSARRRSALRFGPAVSCGDCGGGDRLLAAGSGSHEQARGRLRLAGA